MKHNLLSISLGCSLIAISFFLALLFLKLVPLGSTFHERLSWGEVTSPIWLSSIIITIFIIIKYINRNKK